MTSNDEHCRIVVIIPALNEASTISAIVKGITELYPAIVVDDGSTDDTAALAHEAGAFVLRHDRNLGYESALSSGLKIAIENGYTHAITMDADGQHDPSTIQSFADAILEGAVLVIGQRDRLQRFSENVFSLVAQRLWGIADPLCGIKAYKLSLLEKFGPFDTFKSVGTELAMRILWGGNEVAQIPIVTKSRDGQSKFGGAVGANIKIFKALILTCIKSWK